MQVRWHPVHPAASRKAKTNQRRRNGYATIGEQAGSVHRHAVSGRLIKGTEQVEMMEHRYFPRMQIALGVDVFRSRRLLGYFKTRDISLEGMFIETGGIGLARNDIVRFRLQMIEDESFVRGIVVHVSKEGIGINLIDTTLFYLFRDQRQPIRKLLSDIRSNGLNRYQ